MSKCEQMETGNLYRSREDSLVPMIEVSKDTFCCAYLMWHHSMYCTVICTVRTILSHLVYIVCTTSSTYFLTISVLILVQAISMQPDERMWPKPPVIR